jgi:hypothetical protein
VLSEFSASATGRKVVSDIRALERQGLLVRELRE